MTTDSRITTAASDNLAGPMAPSAAGQAETTTRLQSDAIPLPPSRPADCHLGVDPNSPKAKEWAADSRSTETTPLQLNADGTYTVGKHDCLSTIATRILHMQGRAVDGRSINEEVNELKHLNNHKYKLEDPCTNLQRDWHLRVNVSEASHRPPPPAPYREQTRDWQARPDQPVVPGPVAQPRYVEQPPAPAPGYGAGNQDGAYAGGPQPGDYRQPFVPPPVEVNPIAPVVGAAAGILGLAGEVAGGVIGAALNPLAGPRVYYEGRHHYRGPYLPPVAYDVPAADGGYPVTDAGLYPTQPYTVVEPAPVISVPIGWGPHRRRW